jgi:cobalt-zinc-cadmium efflux system protein
MRRDQRLRTALALNVGVVACQVVAGVVARSVGLLADAGHNLGDVAALALSLLAVRLARRPATPERSFGWHRSTILAAQANAATLLAVCAFIAYEAVDRLLHPTEVRGGLVVAAAAGAAIVNTVAARILNAHHHDLNMRAAFLHAAADAAVSVGVAASGAVILLTGRFDRLDAAVSLVVAAAIAWHALRLARAATEVLLEATPAGLPLDELAATMAAVDGVEAVHDLHVWSLSSDVRALSAHLVLRGHPTLEEAQEVAGRVKAAIADPYGIAHATLELECETCLPPELSDACDLDPGVSRR